MTRHTSPSLHIAVTAALMTQPRTLPELAAEVQVDIETARRVIKRLHRAGLVYIRSYRHTGHNPPPVYAWQPSPGARRDAVREPVVRRQTLALRPKMPTPDFGRASVWAMAEVQA